jgi:hypothetical protein
MNDYSKIYVDSDSEQARLVYKDYSLRGAASTNFGGIKARKWLKAGRRSLRYMDILELHEDMKDWLGQQIDNVSVDVKRIIVLKHHAPSSVMTVKRPDHEPNSYLMPSKQDIPSTNNYYSSDCEEIFIPPVVAWISGHTHMCIETRINGIQSLSNCFGYPGQNPKVDLSKYITF